jgi:hypothetical protein
MRTSQSVGTSAILANALHVEMRAARTATLDVRITTDFQQPLAVDTCGHRVWSVVSLRGITREGSFETAGDHHADGMQFLG